MACEIIIFNQIVMKKRISKYELYNVHDHYSIDRYYNKHSKKIDKVMMLFLTVIFSIFFYELSMNYNIFSIFFYLIIASLFTQILQFNKI